MVVLPMMEKAVSNPSHQKTALQYIGLQNRSFGTQAVRR